MTRKKKIRSFLFLLWIFLAAGDLPVLAGAERAEVLLPAAQEFVPEDAPAGLDASFSYLLQAETAGAPLPEGASEEGCRFSLRGSDSLEVGPISYEQAGVYEYLLSCSEKEREGYDCDRRTYRIRVYVRNTEDGRLTGSVVIENEKGEKTEQAMFRHSWRGAPPEKTGSNPDTGDRQTTALRSLALILAAAVLLCLLRYKRKKEAAKPWDR